MTRICSIHIWHDRYMNVIWQFKFCLSSSFSYMIDMISLPGFRTAWRDTPEMPPEPDDDHGDHGEPVPEDEEFDSRPDQADMDAAIADFLNASKLRNGTSMQGYTVPCHACPFQERRTRRHILSTLRWRQVFCPTWITRRCGASHPQRCCCISMPRTTGMFV